MENSAMIHTVPFTNLVNWSVQYLIDTEFSYNEKYDLIPIGDFLTRNKTQIVIQDNIDYKRATIKVRNGGISLRDKVNGKLIGTKNQFLIKEGQFLLSKIDARNGAFGVVPDEVDGGIITGNFWTFDIDTDVINPIFLSLIVTTPEFIQFCENASNGTTNRHYLQEDLFLAQQIPLPSISEQNSLVANYKQKISLADEQVVKANQLKKEIQSYLESSLKIKENEIQQKSKGLQFVHFKDTSRWDSLFLIGNIPSIDSKYPLVTFETVISSFNKGENGKSIRINSKDFPNEYFRYIGMEHIEKETGQLLELNEVKGKEIKSQTLRVPEGFLLFGKLRPYLNKYWLNDTQFDNIICSSEFFVFDVIGSMDKMFFKYVLSSDFIQTQITDKTSGARMPRINESIFYNLQFPLPPLNAQIQISEHISSMKQEIVNLRKLAEQNRISATQEFEKEIFKSK